MKRKSKSYRNFFRIRSKKNLQTDREDTEDISGSFEVKAIDDPNIVITEDDGSVAVGFTC